jgi:ABC-type nitrate/sulfonate/bicarbonate transport system substrate-binding protein
MSTQSLTRLRVNVFPGGFNWPVFAATELGYFARHGLEIELQATSGSVPQMKALAAERFEIAMTAFDNVVAYVEGEGEARIGPQPDLFAFLGSDDGFLSLVATPDISSAAELHGRTVLVDAVTTGYAFVLFDMLYQAGLNPEDYSVVKAGGMSQRFRDLCRSRTSATLLSAPYDLLAEAAGLRILGRLEGAYQGNVAAALRGWAANNRALTVAYVRAYCDALQWLHQPDNRLAACSILQRNAAPMTAELAASSYARLIEHSGGFSPDGRLEPAGISRVLQLRTRYGPNRRLLNDAEKYIDLSFWHGQPERAAQR